MRFDKCIEVLEYVIGTKILDNKNYDHPDKPEKDPMGYPINKWNDGRIDHVEEERLADLARERQRERAQMEMFDDPYMNWSGHR